MSGSYIITSALPTLPTTTPIITPTLSHAILQITHGGALPSPTTTTTNPFTSSLALTSQSSAVLHMAIAMSLHYLAYNLVRPTTIALFTSDSPTGFKHNPSAFPLAMAFISPSSLSLLMLYGRILGGNGPRTALRWTTYLCSISLLLSGVLLHMLLRTRVVPASLAARVQKPLVALTFVFRESYVQLLTSQYWSFFSSVLTPDQSAIWFSKIAGLTSITSAMAGLVVGRVVDVCGLGGGLCVGGLVLGGSVWFGEKAYTIAKENGFDPSDKNPKSTTTTSSNESDSTISKASALFRRVPVLRALFLEILAGQGLATLLNVCFVAELGRSIEGDADRAGWMGNFYALTNTICCALQFGIVPRIMPYLEPRHLWRFMPLVMVSSTSYLSSRENANLYLIGGLFMLWKVMEFSIRRLLDEMVYVPLDFESRFLGKEIISVFGYRFGKSGMSLFLSGLTKAFGNFGSQGLSRLTAGAAVIWLSAAWNVSNLVPTKAQATETYNKRNA